MLRKTIAFVGAIMVVLGIVALLDLIGQAELASAISFPLGFVAGMVGYTVGTNWDERRKN